MNLKKWEKAREKSEKILNEVTSMNLSDAIKKWIILLFRCLKMNI